MRGQGDKGRGRQGIGELGLRSPLPGRIVWHKISDIPGPHLVKYLWWFATNHLWRWWDRRFQGLRYDLVYSPGINCLNADVISVHIVFAEFYKQVKAELSLRRNSIQAWPRLIHRRLYYQLIIALERLVYTRKDLLLAVVSRKTAEDLARFYGRDDHLPVVYYGLDLERFTPEVCTHLRPEARRALGLSKEAFVLLLIGNDWKKKGLSALLEGVGRLRNPSLWILVVGQDDPAPYRAVIERHGLRDRVLLLPPRPDVEFYYAAADAYVGPSLEDAFALPPAEAMACGLPVIVSSRAGASEVVTDGVDGLILKDPTNAEKLAQLIRQLYNDPKLRRRLGENAVRTAQQYTWDRNAKQMCSIFETVLAQKCKGAER